jgi:hypothetical protein
VPDPDPTVPPATVAGPIDGPVPRLAPGCALPLSGAPGELIDRLAWLIDQDDRPLVQRWWAEIGMIVAVSIGGGAAEVMPSVRSESNRSDEAASHSGVVRVGRAAYVAAIRSRLFELADDGLDERFLVRSLRDEIASFLATDYLPVTVSLDDVDELVARVLTDDSLRARLRDLNHYFAARSDAETIDELAGVDAAGDPSPDPAALDALAQWAAQEAWATTADQAVSDEHFEEWLCGGRQAGRPVPRLRVVPPADPSPGETGLP